MEIMEPVQATIKITQDDIDLYDALGFVPSAINRDKWLTMIATFRVTQIRIIAEQPCAYCGLPGKAIGGIPNGN